MAVHKLSLNNLENLDGGRIPIAFDQALRRAIADCVDSPGNDKARKINLQCEVKPILDDRGDCVDATFEFKVKMTLPQRQSRVYTGQVRELADDQYALAFNDLSDDNPHQKTID